MELGKIIFPFPIILFFIKFTDLDMKFGKLKFFLLNFLIISSLLSILPTPIKTVTLSFINKKSFSLI